MFQGNRISRARQQTPGTAKPNISSRALCLQDLRKITKFHLFGRIRCGWKPHLPGKCVSPSLYEVGFHSVLECAPRCVGFEAYLPPTSVFSVSFYPTYGADSPLLQIPKSRKS